jgi:hypothetical protein
MIFIHSNGNHSNPKNSYHYNKFREHNKFYHFIYWGRGDGGGGRGASGGRGEAGSGGVAGRHIHA